MIPAIIFVISVVACVQFAVLYWRAMMHGIAAQPVSGRIMTAMKLAGRSVERTDFRPILGVYEMAPDLRGFHKPLGVIRCYYWIVEKAGSLSPAIQGWANR